MSTTSTPSMRAVILFRLLTALSLILSVSAQASSTQNSTSSSATPSVSLFLTTSSATISSVTRSRASNVPVTTVVPIVFNITSTITPTATSSAPSNSTASSTPTPTPIVLATTLDPAFGVLGALLIITGLPSAFWGHKNRWTSFFLIGFYTLSLVCIVLIIKFGVLPAINPPTKTLRGMFVLASAVAGIAGGGIAIFFWKGAKYFIGAWGGFALGLWVQCLHNGGLIQSVTFRWILYIGCALIGFVLCTIPKLHYHVLLISTAFVGASAFMLGVDCFTTAGLKEFYIWNLGFRSLFPKFTDNGIEFPVSQTMQIELGLTGAVALMGIAVQLRIIAVLHRKLEEIAQEQKKRDEEAEAQAADRFASVLQERDEWEKEHATLGRHGRNESGFSNMPLMKDLDGVGSPTADEHRSSTFTLVNDRRPRYQSGVSDFFAAPTPEDDLNRAARNPQTPGALPAMDLGLGIAQDVPRNFIAERRGSPTPTLTPQQLEELKKKEDLLLEIQTIRKSIEQLKLETPSPSDGSRHPSLTSRRTLSMDAHTHLLPGPSHLRPPREHDPRSRVKSMELSTLSQSSALGESIGRPTSVPLRDRDQDWDAYVRDRKLLQPPAGITPPIATTPLAPRVMAPAVAEALDQRRRRESALEQGVDSSSDDIPVANLARVQHKKASSSGHIPVSILPPRTTPIVAPTPQRPAASRTRTFEELNQRHREKIRDLQAPLTQAERKHAELEAAKNRWERSKALEKDAVTKRQAEKAALYVKGEKKRKSEDEPERIARTSLLVGETGVRRSSRSLSADKLATLGGSSKRLSTLKVEDWQKYQQEVGGQPERRGSKTESVPFPDNSRARDRRKGDYRDPPN